MKIELFRNPLDDYLWWGGLATRRYSIFSNTLALALTDHPREDEAIGRQIPLQIYRLCPPDPIISPVAGSVREFEKISDFRGVSGANMRVGYWFTRVPGIGKSLYRAKNFVCIV